MELLLPLSTESRFASIIKPLSTSNLSDSAFDDVLASIARAKEQKQKLEKELNEYNTWNYLFLEAGAEALALTRSVFDDAKSKTVMIWGEIIDSETKKKVENIVRLAFLSSASTIKSVSSQDSKAAPESEKLSDLMHELARLRDEMRAMNYQRNELNSTMGSTLSTLSRPVLNIAKLEPTRPLPFNVGMLTSVKLKAALISSVPPAPKMTEPKNDSMQAMLQRVLQEKFKNVREANATNVDDSFDQSKIMDESSDEEEENVMPPIRNVVGGKPPPLPPRPVKQVSHSSVAAAPTGKVLSARNR